jgi:hypothetical protein
LLHRTFCLPIPLASLSLSSIPSSLLFLLFCFHALPSPNLFWP